MPATRNRRVAGPIEVRVAGDTATVEGYASTFDQPYDMGWYSERVARGAFTKTLSEAPDVRFLINHEGLALARTTNGTIDLSQDSGGLHHRTQFNMQRNDVRDAVYAIQDGAADQMSFAFRTIRDEWDDKYENRNLTELSLSNGDISLVTYPANPNTSISVRAKQVLDADPDELRAAYRAIREERAGKTISASTQKQLEQVLESLNAIDEATDEAVETLAALLGTTPPSDEDDGTTSDESESQARTGRHPSVVRAEIENFLLLRK